ncbi:aspartate/glutamate racemase family protein [Arthrobacter sp. NPDC093125]|uniref:aspartate/glutamate racemase family protein n=1 Tax=Arthrobacter sp. NPDC093125 TaxID=3363944 RepID=UPI0037F9775F
MKKLLAQPMLSKDDDQAAFPMRRAATVVGILGGMGPVATADFYLKLIEATPARQDQEHLRTLIWSDPTIPDRTRALLENGADPTPAIIAGARLLQNAGASLLAVPCNTAHAFLGPVHAAVNMPIIHMIEETARYIGAIQPPVGAVGLLATTGTVQAGLYQEWLEKRGITVLTPVADDQERYVMASIRRIKSGDTSPCIRANLKNAAARLIASGAQRVIAGCTEIPIGLDEADVSVPLVDPARVLAASVVRHSLTVAGAAVVLREE